MQSGDDQTMTEFSSPQGSSVAAAPMTESAHQQALSSDLAKLCLSATLRDEYRSLAWVNSICFLFLLIGLIGLKPPKIKVKPLSQPVEAVPVVFIPPPEQPKNEPEQQQPDEAQPTEEIVTPPVATVVAPDAAAVAFAVPVEGAVVVAQSARLAAPPPPAPKPAGPKLMKFTGTDGGSYPEPSYPRAAMVQHEEGIVTLILTVDPEGNVTSAKVKTSSGSFILDKDASHHTLTKYKFPPIDTGEMRLYEIPIIYQLK